MLQNRVDPWGQIIRTSARGTWMGNRGLIHNEHRQIVRPFRLKAWITCVLEFKGRHRQVMTPNLYTELFFLDEATSFSAGHRPCAECRRPDFLRWKNCWLLGNPDHGFTEKTLIREIDAILHQERMERDSGQLMYTAGGVGSQRSPVRDERDGSRRSPVRELPDGCFIVWEAKACLVVREGNSSLVASVPIFPWTPFGYGEAITLPDAEIVEVLTPASIVRSFRAGYVPQKKL